MHFRLPRGVRARLLGKPRTPLSSQVATRISWSPLSSLKGVQPPLPFGERTRDCSAGHAGKKALSSRGRGRLRAFLELQRPWGFSPEARRGSQGASRAAPGKSGLHVHGEVERVMALESREGTRASRRVEEGLTISFSGGGGEPSFPSPSAGDLRELPTVPLRGEGSCGGGGAPPHSAGSGSTEEGLTSRGGRNLRLALRFGLRPQGPCRVGTGESGLVLSEEGNPLASRVAQGVSGPSSSCVWNPRVFGAVPGP